MLITLLNRTPQRVHGLPPPHRQRNKGLGVLQAEVGGAGGELVSAHLDRKQKGKKQDLTEVRGWGQGGREGSDIQQKPTFN